ncbi:hypothetical protein [Paeniglutamicibacter kerguelensis]|uniref:Uncharacterized protein n=1 Tax=Paeniglutamicibacter kerguelensis TaxID=254788 RepID=A0ABS4XA96_9MICC|nr:hypothetical protein [Paeniglutamicibacter kerguelensis]MBP2385393.1 hypothetical protein [Paeniglutamicibacter kerguelensis]
MDRKKRWVAAAALGGALLVPGCAGQPADACPELALLEGFPVVVEAGVAPAGFDSVMVRACQGGTCHAQDVDLVPGSTSVDAGCSPAVPTSADTACSASAVPDGTLVGYWVTGDFNPGPIDVEASAPGFGPVRGTVEGRLESSGSGACLQRVFQTPLHIGADSITSPVN